MAARKEVHKGFNAMGSAFAPRNQYKVECCECWGVGVHRRTCSLKDLLPIYAAEEDHMITAIKMASGVVHVGTSTRTRTAKAKEVALLRDGRHVFKDGRQPGVLKWELTDDEQLKGILNVNENLELMRKHNATIVVHDAERASRRKGPGSVRSDHSDDLSRTSETDGARSRGSERGSYTGALDDVDLNRASPEVLRAKLREYERELKKLSSERRQDWRGPRRQYDERNRSPHRDNHHRSRRGQWSAHRRDNHVSFPENPRDRSPVRNSDKRNVVRRQSTPRAPQQPRVDWAGPGSSPSSISPERRPLSFHSSDSSGPKPNQDHERERQTEREKRRSSTMENGDGKAADPVPDPIQTAVSQIVRAPSVQGSDYRYSPSSPGRPTRNVNGNVTQRPNETVLNITAMHQQQRAKHLIKETPVLTGEDKENKVFAKWKRAMLQYREIAETEDDFMEFVLSRTDGDAFQVVNTLKGQGWDVVYAQLERDYDPTGTKENAFTAFHNLSQGSRTAVEYNEEVMRLVAKLEYDIMEVNSAHNVTYVSGLNCQHLRKKLKHKMYTNTLYRLMNTVREDEQASEFAKGSAVKVRSAKLLQPEDRPKKLSNDLEAFPGAPLSGTDDEIRELVRRINDVMIKKSDFWCQICDTVRHDTRECPEKMANKCRYCKTTVKPGELTEHSNVCRDGRCNYCNRRGHISAECKVKEYDMNTKPGSRRKGGEDGADRGSKKDRDYSRGRSRQRRSRSRQRRDRSRSRSKGKSYHPRAHKHHSKKEHKGKHGSSKKASEGKKEVPVNAASNTSSSNDKGEQTETSESEYSSSGSSGSDSE